MHVTDDNAFGNPHLWLASYGIRSHYFCWAVAHGALDDIDHGEPARQGFVQPALLPDVDPFEQPALRATRGRVYRSRSPHRADVMVEDIATRRLRRMLGIRLRDERVIR